jgi:hypothetical protein
MSHIRDAVSGASAYLTDHPDEARYRDSHARARLSDGLRVEVDGLGGEQLVTDMPRSIGGAATAPSHRCSAYEPPRLGSTCPPTP